MKTKVFMIGLLLAAFINQANAQDKPKEEFKPSGKLWGYAFADFSYKMGSDRDSIIALGLGDAEYAKTYKNNVGIGLRRFYLGYDYNVAPAFTGHLILEGGDAILTPTGDRTVMIKSLNVEWKEFIPKHTLFLGQAGTQSFNVAEKVWNYRSVEKTIGDYRKVLTSNDFGFKVVSQYKIDSLGNNKIGYSFQYGTGKGPKPEDNRLKKYYAGIDASLFKEKVLIAVNYEYELFEDKPILPGIEHGKKSTSTIEGVIAYQHEKFTLGVEYITQLKKNEITDTTGRFATVSTGATFEQDTVALTQNGLSVFARGTVLKDKLYAFARYDMFKKNYKNGLVMTSKAMYYDESFLTVGLDYTPNKNVHIIPNIWMNTYDDRRKKPDTGYDVSMVSSRNSYYERKADMMLRLTIYYVFGK